MTHEKSQRDDPAPVKQDDRLVHTLTTDVTDAALGAAAGAAAGLIAGPPGLIAGAVIGAIAGGVLGHSTDRDMRAAADHDRDLDAIDAEEEFFDENRPLDSAASKTTPSAVADDTRK